ncbi:hypothetical protein [Enterococcus casseliflavus]|uniref:hypothetical protein n=1 Tax=Enterococcus casseliflavus TaxID=37734 RepID=UPI0030190BDC
MNRIKVYLRDQVIDRFSFSSHQVPTYEDRDSFLGSCESIQMEKEPNVIERSFAGSGRIYSQEYTMILDNLQVDSWSDYILIDLKKKRERVSKVRRIGISAKNKRNNEKKHLFNPRYPLNAKKRSDQDRKLSK